MSWLDPDLGARRLFGDTVTDWVQDQFAAGPATDADKDMLDDVKDMSKNFNQREISAIVNSLPIPWAAKQALHLFFRKQRVPRGPSVKKRPEMAYGTRRKRAYTPRRRAYSKKPRKVYRKKSVSKRRTNASNATMNLIWKAMKSRL